MPVAICFQNRRSISRRCDGAPGERIVPRPVNFCIHPAGRPINTPPSIKVLRRPVESAQFTSFEFTQLVKDNGVAISMDGHGCWRDNVFVERLWKSIKYEEVYLRSYATVSQARDGIGRYLNFYNARRPHSSLDAMTPDEYDYRHLPALQPAA